MVWAVDGWKTRNTRERRMADEDTRETARGSNRPANRVDSSLVLGAASVRLDGMLADACCALAARRPLGGISA